MVPVYLFHILHICRIQRKSSPRTYLLANVFLTSSMEISNANLTIRTHRASEIISRTIYVPKWIHAKVKYMHLVILTKTRLHRSFLPTFSLIPDETNYKFCAALCCWMEMFDAVGKLLASDILFNFPTNWLNTHVWH